MLSGGAMPSRPAYSAARLRCATGPGPTWLGARGWVPVCEVHRARDTRAERRLLCAVGVELEGVDRYGVLAVRRPFHLEVHLLLHDVTFHRGDHLSAAGHGSLVQAL